MPATPTPATSNPLYDLIPAKSRRTTYAVFGLLGLILGAVQIAFLAVDPNLPTALNVCILVYNFFALPFGALAASNVPSPERLVMIPQAEMDDFDPELDLNEGDVIVTQEDEDEDPEADLDYDVDSLPSDEAPVWTEGDRA